MPIPRSYLVCCFWITLLAGVGLHAQEGDPISGKVVAQDAAAATLTLMQPASGERETFSTDAGDAAIDWSGHFVTGYVTASPKRKDGSRRIHHLLPNDPYAVQTQEAVNRMLRRDTVERGRRGYRGEGDYLPVFALWNQHGDLVQADDLKGKYTVINFIFTRCAVPEMCPASTMRMVSLDKQLDTVEREDVRLVSITFDPAFDTPGILHRYAEVRGIDQDDHWFLTGPEQAIDDLLRQFGIIVYQADGTIEHSMATLLIDPQGKIVYRKEGSRWSDDRFFEEITNRPSA
ncbi:MAG: SCO family protein [Opitutales bacterium]